MSVIVLNQDCAAFVGEAIGSVAAQTYPFIECIVIDDGSTDDSLSVIHDLQRKHRSIKLIENERSVGQALSLRKALAQAEGSHVIFLDAGDILKPTCVETHVTVHLSLRLPVGFTSVDMQQVLKQRVVTPSLPRMADFIRSRREATPKTEANHLRYLDLSGSIPRPAVSAAQISDLVHYVGPLDGGSQPWAPLSGNCFRREALQLIISNPDFDALQSGPDRYLLPGIAALTGSAIIDRPLAAARLQSGRDEIRSGSLHRIESERRDKAGTHSRSEIRMLIDYLIANATEVTQQLEAPSFYRESLDALAGTRLPAGSNCDAYLNRHMLAHRERLRDLLGRKEYHHWLAYRFLPEDLLRLPLIGFLAKMALIHLVVPVLPGRVAAEPSAKR